MSLIEWGSGSLIFLNLALTGVDIWLFRSVLTFFILIIEYFNQISSFWFNSDVGFQGGHFKCSTWFTWLRSNWTSFGTHFKSNIIHTSHLFWSANYIRQLGSKCGSLLQERTDLLVFLVERKHPVNNLLFTKMQKMLPAFYFRHVHSRLPISPAIYDHPDCACDPGRLYKFVIQFHCRLWRSRYRDIWFYKVIRILTAQSSYLC